MFKHIFASLLLAATLFSSVNANNSAFNAALTGATQGQSAAGAIGGNFNVDRNGSANYSIPIVIPPGIQGMQPSISLGYNQRSPSGLLGVGWSISGFSAVTRCSQNRTQDGDYFKSGVEFNANDRFCLNGQRLVAVSGVYGAHGTEYRTEINTWSRIISEGLCGNGPCTFKVTTKDGQTLSFGESTDTRFLRRGHADVAKWALERVRDRNDNFYVIYYVNDAVNGQLYPDKILYTGNMVTRLFPQFSIEFSYEDRKDSMLKYRMGSATQLTKRLSTITTYLGPTHLGATKVKSYSLQYDYGAASGKSRLRYLTECDGNGVCFPATRFDYSDQYQNNEFNHTSTSKIGGWSNVKSTHARQYLPIDINGDGLPDIAEYVACLATKTCVFKYLNNGFDFLLSGDDRIGDWTDVTAGNARRHLPIDVDGDGALDIVEIVQCNYTDPVGVRSFACAESYRNDGAGFKHFDTSEIGGWSDLDSIRARRYMAIDVDGDNLSDIVEIRACNTDRTCAVVYKNHGRGFNEASVGGSFEIGAWFDPNADDASRYLPMDATGDGQTDIIEISKCRLIPGDLPTIFFGSCAYVHKNIFDHEKAQRGFEAASKSVIGVWEDVTSFKAHRYLPMDVNADGLPDIVRISRCPNNHNIACGYFYRNTGAGFEYVSEFDIGSWWNLGLAETRRYYPMDVNDDGLPDIVQVAKCDKSQPNPGNTCAYIHHNTGVHLNATDHPTAKKSFVQAPDVSDIGGWSDVNGDYARRYFPTDSNGDGLTDIIEIARCGEGFDNVRTCAYVHKNSGVKVDLLTGITDGLNKQISISYKPITDTSVYTKDRFYEGEETDISWINVVSPMLVVSSYEVNEANNTQACSYPNNSNTIVDTNCFRFEYHYEEGISDKLRGWLGFKRVNLFDIQNQKKIITTYKIGFPYTGRIARQETRTAVAEKILEAVNYQYSYCGTGGSCALLSENIYTVFSDKQSTDHYTDVNASWSRKDYTSEIRYDYDKSNGNVTVISNLRDIAALDDDTFQCIEYEWGGTGADWWKSSFPATLKTVSDKAACPNTLNWNASTDLAWTIHSYDAHKNVTFQRQFNDTTQDWITVSYTYDSYGNVFDSTDANGNKTMIGYDRFQNFPVAVTIGDLTTSFKHDQRFGVQTEVNEPGSSRVEQSLDGFGRVVSVSKTAPTGYLEVVQTTDYTWLYDGVNRFHKEVTLLNQWGGVPSLKGSETYDVFARKTHSLNPGFSTAFSRRSGKVYYNAAGQVGYDVMPSYAGSGYCHYYHANDVCREEVTTHYQYDSYGRVKQVTLPSDAITSFSYDNQTAVTSVNDPSNDAAYVDWVVERNSFDQPIKRTAPDGSFVRYHYDLMGRLTEIVDPLGQSRRFTYNSLGQKTADHQNDTGLITYAYDNNGNVIETVDAEGRKTQFSFDARGRLTAKQSFLPNATQPQQTHNYTYDLTMGHSNSVGQLSKIESNAVDYYFNYDLSGALINKETRIDLNGNGTKGEPGVTGERTHNTYVYNALGQVLEVGYPDGSLLRNSYRALDASLEKVDFREGPTGLFKEYARYDHATAYGGVTNITYGNGVESAFTYDVLGRMLSNKTSSATKSFVDLSYQWNKVNKLLGITDNVKAKLSQTFAYNNVGRLIDATGGYGAINYSFDHAGNLLTAGKKTYAMDAVKKHQLKTMTDEKKTYDLTYDLSGNLIGKTSKKEDIRYVYNAAGRLVEVTKDGRLVNKFAYNHAGNRVSKEDYNKKGKLKKISYYISSNYEIVSDLASNTKTYSKHIGGIASITRNVTADTFPASIAGHVEDWMQYTSGGLMADLSSPFSSFNDVSNYFTGKGMQLLYSPHYAQLLETLYWAAFIALLLAFVVFMAISTASPQSALGQFRGRMLFYLVEKGRINRATAMQWHAPNTANGPNMGNSFMRGKLAVWVNGLVLITFLSHSVTPAYAALKPGSNGVGIPEAGAVLYFHKNHLGGTSVVTDEQGKLASSLSYQPYGKIDDKNSSGRDNFRAKYSGKELDVNSGLVYFGARYYDPDLGRFISADAAGQFHSPYLYTSGDPMSEVDPDGNFVFTTAVLGSMLIGALMGGYFGGAAAADSFNPADWDFKSGKLWAGILIGAAIGGIGGGVGAQPVVGVKGMLMVMGAEGLAGGAEGIAFAAIDGKTGADLAAAFGIGFGLGLLTGMVGPLLGKGVDIAKGSVRRHRRGLPTFVNRFDSRGHKEIFSKGFSPKGKNKNMVDHVDDQRLLIKPSAYVAASEKFSVADKFASNIPGDGPRTIYIVRPSNGIRVKNHKAIKAIRSKSTRTKRQQHILDMADDEAEIVNLGRIEPWNIKGATITETGKPPKYYRNRNYIRTPGRGTNLIDLSGYFLM